jgi:hypothetical protein
MKFVARSWLTAEQTGKVKYWAEHVRFDLSGMLEESSEPLFAVRSSAFPWNPVEIISTKSADFGVSLPLARVLQASYVGTRYVCCIAAIAILS